MKLSCSAGKFLRHGKPAQIAPDGAKKDDPTLSLPFHGERSTSYARPPPLRRPVEVGVAIRSLTIERQSSADRLADGVRDGAPRQHPDQMGAIFGTAVNIAVHAVGRDAHALERF